MSSGGAVRALLGLFVPLLFVACGAPAPSPSASGSPSTEDPLRGSVGEALIVTVLDNAGPYFSIRVDAVAPVGASRSIATFVDVHPTGWTSSAPTSDPLLFAPMGWVAVGVEQPAGRPEAEKATLVFNLRDPTQAPRQIAGAPYEAAFGPTGLLAFFDEEVRTVDPGTGHTTEIPIPPGIELRDRWLADGFGFLAERVNRPGNPQPGGLSLDGTFTPGSPAVYAPTGRERPLGAEGGWLSEVVREGPFSSESAIVEVRADPDASGIVWLSYLEPGDSSQYADFAWDATGTGLWVVFTAVGGGGSWLSHIPKPEVERRVVDLPGRASWRVVGVSPDDRWIVVSSEDLGQLLFIDAILGEVRQLARSALDSTWPPVFVGWTASR